ncbi:uncharacterized protein PHALS_05365 [Plasmopara halstedii]|uniref:Uncharacterized protein n=1 Tax=Plasmopara halstedii TaxID=4781 RepID=A0A0P1AA21_PLAHL|nr:uncharacterized protein PHALS_05365 [Plasmopara halstedii]CEG37586.1 hypothetical protein PHALS_05365 [Plasmopara halstedii]|eukprot:XP_024573955.1 hypothetical protein PHALS_05365 [Plasmopara halstedii]
MILAWLVVLSAMVLTLEIQRHLLLARILGAIVMVLGWGCLLSSQLQLQAICCAIVYHGLIEGLRQWQRNFPCVFEDQKDRKIVLWLLFWARVYTWGTTLGGIEELTTLKKTQETSFQWQEIGMLVFYHEILEVLVMLYFTDEELSYVWKRRIGHWFGALIVGILKTWKQLNVDHFLNGLSPLALIGILLMVMWLSIEIRWDRIAQKYNPTLIQEEEMKVRWS